MAKYTCSTTIRISMHCEVEAESAEAAKEIATELPMQQLCHHCTNEKPKGQWVTSGELDGDPEAIEVEKECE